MLYDLAVSIINGYAARALRMIYHRCDFESIVPLREQYRQELHCQIVHDSAHYRPNCSQAFVVEIDGHVAGYGSVWNGTYWMTAGSIYEFYVVPEHRISAFKLFETFVQSVRPPKIYAQTNDPFLGVYIYSHVRQVNVRSILFEDWKTTHHCADNVQFRQRRPEDEGHIFEHKVEPVGDWLIEKDGRIVGTGGVLYHYNKPYGDIFMEIDPAFRRRGCGQYLVQELKRVCREAGNVPAARTSTRNIASRNTLIQAGFSPCGHLIMGDTLSDNLPPITAA